MAQDATKTALPRKTSPLSATAGETHSRWSPSTPPPDVPTERGQRGLHAKIAQPIPRVPWPHTVQRHPANSPRGVWWLVVGVLLVGASPGRVPRAGPLAWRCRSEHAHDGLAWTEQPTQDHHRPMAIPRHARPSNPRQARQPTRGPSPPSFLATLALRARGRGGPREAKTQRGPPSRPLHAPYCHYEA